jgi:hypothetical protein
LEISTVSGERLGEVDDSTRELLPCGVRAFVGEQRDQRADLMQRGDDPRVGSAATLAVTEPSGDLLDAPNSTLGLDPRQGEVVVGGHVIPRYDGSFPGFFDVLPALGRVIERSGKLEIALQPTEELGGAHRRLPLLLLRDVEPLDREPEERLPLDVGVDRVFDHVRVLVLVEPVFAFAPMGMGVERGPVFGVEIDTGLTWLVYCRQPTPVHTASLFQ